MAQEKEIKLILKIPLKEFLKRIKEKNFKKIKTIKQEDIYFDTKDWKLYKSLAALRLRKTNNKSSSFSFKKLFFIPKLNNKWYVEEDEIDFPLQDTKTLTKIFTRLNIPYHNEKFNKENTLAKFLENSGYQSDEHFKKTRTIYEDKQGFNEISVNNVEKVGIIVELECSHEDPHKVANQLLNSDEWKSSNEGLGYMWLKKVKGFSDHIKMMKKLKSNPALNVWENEKDLYENLCINNNGTLYRTE
jgi:adenylate cyclase class IV